jgi:hypothetical protein
LAQNYNFVKSTGTYADLAAPTVLSAAAWDEEDYNVAIGFPFTIAGATYDSVNISSYGEFTFSSAASGAFNMIIAYEADLVDREIAASPSTVSYLRTGTAPNRILKIEFKNVGFYDGATAPAFANEFANFQVWFYEGTSKVEMHYGTSTVVNGLATFYPGPGSVNGIVTNFDLTTGAATGPFLTGSPASPVSTVTTTQFNMTSGFWAFPTLSALPANGDIFAFTPSTSTGIAKGLNNASAAIYPNPAEDVITITGLPVSKNEVNVRIFDALGKVVLNQEIAAGSAVKVNVSNLPKGTYFLEATSGESRMGKQLIKL